MRSGVAARDAAGTIVGYHGTTQEVARQIVNRDYPISSRRTGDWLGDGLYFWQDAPWRALWWAERRARYAQATSSRADDHRAAIVRVEIAQVSGIDLLDSSPSVTHLLRAAYTLVKTSSP